MAEAAQLGDSLRPRDLAGRLDCRHEVVVTIDPATAEDFDDAFSVHRDAEGRFRLRVHVADVAHYVLPGTMLDREALRRGNSTYLVDRVVPMLPEPLSNGLCSLRPGVDRLTRCVDFLIAADGRVEGARIHRAVIRSHRRLTYEEALDILAAKPRTAVERTVHDAAALATWRRARRLAQGALPLEVPETRLHFDDRGRLERVERVAGDPAHRLVEELMLLANEAVAARLVARGQPALHRVHGAPEAERLETLGADMRRAGVHCGDLRDRDEILRLMDRLDRTPAGSTLRLGILKTMPKARYDSSPLGHYGLAKAHYTHFTSPIRRYADLVVHRMLDARSTAAATELDHLAAHLSATEIRSAAAERSSRDRRLFEHLAHQLRERPDEGHAATVARIVPQGCVVDLTELGVSALWRHRPGARALRIGETLRVRLAEVDLARMRLRVRPASAAGARSRRQSVTMEYCSISARVSRRGAFRGASR